MKTKNINKKEEKFLILNLGICENLRFLNKKEVLKKINENGSSGRIIVEVSELNEEREAK